MNRDGFRLAPLAALALVAIACAEPAPEPEPLRPVRTELVLATGGGRVRSFSGRARAGQETNLSFRVPGRIQALNVKLGDAIRRGQVLAELEPDDFEIAVEQARAELANAQATAENAEADLARIRGLFERDSVSRGQDDSALARSKSAQARVEALAIIADEIRAQLAESEKAAAEAEAAAASRPDTAKRTDTSRATASPSKQATTKRSTPSKASTGASSA